MKGIKWESRTALILSICALSVALGGNAVAYTFAAKGGGGHHKIRKGEIAKGAVTASALANGAVTGNKIRTGAVGERAIRPESVSEHDLANGAVTARVLAAQSVYGAALGPVEVASVPIKDADVSEDLSTWTNSASVAASCPNNGRVLSGGVNFTNPGNRRVGTIISVPSVNGGTNSWQGGITSDAGGSAEASVVVLCLKAGP
jgi:hypothetical protein